MNEMISDKPLFTIVNNFYAFLLVNACFMISNLLFLVVFFLGIGERSLMLISLIPAGPALSGAFYAMGKLQREKQISPWTDYWKGYKQNFKIALVYWVIQLILLFILLNNHYYITRTGNFSVFIFLNLALTIFVAGLNLYAFPIMVRFEMKVKDLWIISILYFFRHWKLTFLNVTTVISFAIIYFQFPFLTLLFLTSIVSFLVMLNLRKVLLEMEGNVR